MLVGVVLGAWTGVTGWGADARVAIPVACALAGAWWWALSRGRTRDRRVVGVGTGEYVRVARATWNTAAVVAVVAALLVGPSVGAAPSIGPAPSTGTAIGAGQVAVGMPVGLFLVLLGRWLWRRPLNAARAWGSAAVPILLAGRREDVEHLARSLRRRPDVGLVAVAACLEGPPGGDVAGLPVLGVIENSAERALEAGAGAVVVGIPPGGGDLVRRLEWSTAAVGLDFAVASPVTEVRDARLIAARVPGARLLHVVAPRFRGPRYVGKVVFDVVAAAVLTVLLLPFLGAVAVAVRVTSPGPAIFRQTRPGRDGVLFTMYKFRSMEVGAEARLDEVIEDVGLYYKPVADPRVTPIGRLLRRTSMDELPQLFNVLLGHMSLVGPRPQTLREFAQYDDVTARRLLVKPGLTGLWQVSGRSNLSVEESLRFDLYYVDNWTFVGDLWILARTAGAVVRGAGAS